MNENINELETVPLLLTPLVDPLPPVALTHGLQKEPQAGSYLCWAAAAVALARFYDPTSGLTQCEMATKMLVKREGSGECCPFTHPVSLSCDRPEDTAEVLSEIGLFARQLEGQPGLDQVILDELREDRPVVIVKGNHVIVVHEGGTDGSDVTLEAFDPGKDLLNRTLVLTGNEHEIEAICLTKRKDA
jgi:hypothetical protein